MSEKKILIIEDENDIIELVTFNLKKEGYTIDWESNGNKALTKVKVYKPDLILLDIMLPEMDGYEILKQLKAEPDTKNIPVIMLTARSEEIDVIMGLEFGADDYISKPFSPKILIARIRATLRRKNSGPTDEKDIIRIGNLEIHPGKREVLLKQSPVILTFSEFNILHMLARRPLWVFSRSQIVDEIKGYDSTVTNRSVDVTIVGIRKKLKDHARYVETIRGVGYRFNLKNEAS